MTPIAPATMAQLTAVYNEKHALWEGYLSLTHGLNKKEDNQLILTRINSLIIPQFSSGCYTTYELTDLTRYNSSLKKKINDHFLDNRKVFERFNQVAGAIFEKMGELQTHKKSLFGGYKTDAAENAWNTPSIDSFLTIHPFLDILIEMADAINTTPDTAELIAKLQKITQKGISLPNPTKNVPILIKHMLQYESSTDRLFTYLNYIGIHEKSGFASYLEKTKLPHYLYGPEASSIPALFTLPSVIVETLV